MASDPDRPAGQVLVDATISSGSSVSDDLDISGYKVVQIFMPAAFDGARLAFQTRPDTSGTYQLAYDRSDNQIVVHVSQGRNYLIAPELLAGLEHFRIRSEDGSGNAQNESADRTITLALMPIG